MTREEALELVKQYLHNKNLIKHCLAVEACMKGLARRLGGNEEIWGLAGLLHDLDYELTEKSPELHTTETVKILENIICLLKSFRRYRLMLAACPARALWTGPSIRLTRRPD